VRRENERKNESITLQKKEKSKPIIEVVSMIL
jgi:hypothetical protein